MKKSTKRKLKKFAILTIPAAFVWGGLLAWTGISCKALMSVNKDKFEFEKKLIEEYTSTDNYLNSLEDYKAALQNSLDHEIISQTEYYNMLNSKTSDQNVLKEISLDPAYTTEYKQYEEKIKNQNNKAIPFVLSAILAAELPVFYPFGVFICSKKKTYEDSPYDNQYRYSSTNASDLELQ